MADTEPQIQNGDPIKSIEQTIDDIKHIFPVGADADNIQITIGQEPNQIKCTLTDFFNNWKDFKDNNDFFYYGHLVPENTETPEQAGKKLPSQIKVWYDAQ